MSKAFLLSLLILLISPSIASAQVLINEFSSFESPGDWVELYAFEDTDISGWIIRDTTETSIVETIPGGVFIGPSSSVYYVVEVGNRLNKSGDIIKLYKDDDSTLVNQIPYGDQGGVCAPGSGQAAGRYPDGNSTMERFSGDTKGLSNDSAQLDPCPTPTPIPTNTPTPTTNPTSTPKPTKTPTPTKSPTPKPTVKAAATKAPTGFRGSSTDEGERESLALGLRDELSVTPTPGESEELGTGGKFPWLAGVFVLAGAGFIGAAVYPFLKKRYNLGSVTKQKDN